MSKYSKQLKALKKAVIEIAESKGIKLTGDEFQLSVIEPPYRYDIHFETKSGAQGNVFFNGYGTEKGFLNGITKAPRIEETYNTIIQWIK
ncbi:hypothetical protein R4036_004594 [Salmonella enterica]|nr:hypothetical protein [Salmonella enterica]